MEDGKTKQDCENAAVKRWLSQNRAQEKKQTITLLGDDLYSRQSICELSLKQDYNFIFVAKPSSHKSMYKWLSYLEKNGEVITGEIKKLEKRRTFFNDIRAVIKYEWFKKWSQLLGERNFGWGV